MQNDIFLIGEIGWEVTLDSVVKAVEKSDKDKPLNIHIHSGGGAVYDGLAIYNYLKGLDQEVNTQSAGLVASIASIIFLSGRKETRKINETDSFLIHLPTNMAFGNADDLEKNAEELRDIEDKLSSIYATETDLTKEEAIDQMKENKMIDVEWLKDKGFVSEIIKFKAVAKYNFNNNKMEKKGLTKKDKNWFEGIFNKYFSSPKNKIVQDANGTELDFTDLEDDATPSIGDKAMVDGEKASGDYTMPSGDVYKFEDGELMEIVKEENDIEALKTENEELKTKLAEAEANIETAETANAKMLIDIEEIKNKVTSSFEWSGKEKKEKKEPRAELFVPKNRKQ